MTELDQAINTLTKPWTSADLRQVWDFVGGADEASFDVFLKAVFWLDRFPSSPPVEPPVAEPKKPRAKRQPKCTGCGSPFSKHKPSLLADGDSVLRWCPGHIGNLEWTYNAVQS